MQGFEYHVDLVFCIDATGSMGPVIETVKSNAIRFHPDVIKALGEKDKRVDKMRVKVIGFRDAYEDHALAFETSKFFSLPEEADDLEKFIRGLKPQGGGDEPESGLEALAMAIKSEWTKLGAKRRHVIVIWTDASAHPFEKAATTSSESYPSGMPKSMQELTDLWSGQDVDLSSKRLIAFAPESNPWTTIGAESGGWDNTVWYPSRAGDGLDELSYKEIINAIVNSVG